MKPLVILILLTVLLAIAPAVLAEDRFFQYQVIDTMKFSRDEARSRANDEKFDAVIDRQISQIAATGATHVAIATPYDDEFIPFMRRWVDAARRHRLNVWFRGNMSGWEGWFDYPDIDREEHTKGVIQFITKHPDLFEDGDMFVSCPECENGGPGDPRSTGDTQGHRNFLTHEYALVKKAFIDINKKVTANYYSMNGDVARLIMNRETTSRLDGVVTIDHYVKTPEQLSQDIDEFAKESGGKIMLGEFGAPIPDINGDMTEEEQAKWITDTMTKMVNNKHVIGMNYWVNEGGSTHLWSEGKPRMAVAALTAFYTPAVLKGRITDLKGKAVEGVTVGTDTRSTQTDAKGIYSLPVYDGANIRFDKDGYISVSFNVTSHAGDVIEHPVTMENTSGSWLRDLIRSILAYFDY